MERKRQREIAIGAGAAVILAIAAYRISTTTAPAPDPTVSQSVATGIAGAAGQQPANQKGQVTDIDLDSLRTGRPGPVGSRRNPFGFKPKPAPPPPPPSTGSRGPTPPPMPVPTGPVQPPPPPRITLKFIGTMESGRAGKYAILTDGRGLPIYGKEGQVIEGRYRILRIGVESVDLAYLDGRGRQTIRQTGQ
jgi:U5 snRNP spliceosome subunit